MSISTNENGGPRSSSWRTREVAMAGLFAALTAVGAQVTIPLPFVPLTLQVLVVLLSGAVLGSRAGLLSQIIYLLMGAVGLPVFAGRSGGFHAFFGTTGGYLIGFALAAWVVGRLTESEERIGPVRGVAAMLAGVLAIYIPGSLVLSIHLGSFVKALQLGVIAFIPADLIKAAAAYLIARGLAARGVKRPALPRAS